MLHILTMHPVFVCIGERPVVLTWFGELRIRFSLNEVTVANDTE